MVLAQWVEEEKALLNRTSALRVEVSGIIDAGVQRVREIRSELNEDTFVNALSVMDDMRRKLARANRRHRDELSRVAVTRWQELADLAARAAMPSLRDRARKARGVIGVAQVTDLAINGMYPE